MIPTEAIQQLRSNQDRLDMDGCRVGVSRQALDEVLNFVEYGGDLPDIDDGLELNEDHPLWCVNEQLKDLMKGFGATEDHVGVVSFLGSTGLPSDTVNLIHQALVRDGLKSKPVRYALLAFGRYYPNGGIDDLRGTFDTLDECREAFKDIGPDLMREQGYTTSKTNGDCTGQIVDLATLQCVETLRA